PSLKKTFLQNPLINFRQSPQMGSRNLDQHDSRGCGLYACNDCGKCYRWKRNLMSHKRFECGKEPQFQCHTCFNGCFNIVVIIIIFKIQLQYVFHGSFMDCNT
ncbi:hypothetical protein L9F63_012170, partial [Diploptera punctata]